MSHHRRDQLRRHHDYQSSCHAGHQHRGEDLRNPLADYYLYTEIAPADFSLATGESLIVLADGVRYAACPPATIRVAETRRGFLTTYYKVAPDVIVAIANSKEVKLRIKGTAGTLERTMNSSSRGNFREFLLKNFGVSASLAAKHWVQ